MGLNPIFHDERPVTNCLSQFFLLTYLPDALVIHIYSVIKLHVMGIFSAHHQEFSTVHSALVSFTQV